MGAFARVLLALHLAQEPIFVLLLPPKRSKVPIRRIAAALEEAGKATAAACKKCFSTAMRIALLITSHLSLSSRGSPMSVLLFLVNTRR